MRVFVFTECRTALSAYGYARCTVASIIQPYSGIVVKCLTSLPVERLSHCFVETRAAVDAFAFTATDRQVFNI